MRTMSVPAAQSRVESVHQVSPPKRRQKNSNIKKLRTLYRRFIQEQLAEPPLEEHFHH